ncbi:hypothetical protein TNCV_4882671 [Trichonephila clavipes]|nr:hypothetical protein TNCV_4882671 [Trichonephila clavipes]
MSGLLLPRASRSEVINIQRLRIKSVKDLAASYLYQEIRYKRKEYSKKFGIPGGRELYGGHGCWPRGDQAMHVKSGRELERPPTGVMSAGYERCAPLRCRILNVSLTVIQNCEDPSPRLIRAPETVLR